MDKSFKTKSKITKRTIEVSEAFGIGIDEEREFVVFRDLEVEINPQDVVYITGESGSGKSLLLKQLYEQMKDLPEFGGCTKDDELVIDPEEVLVEGVGKDTGEALMILSQAGLNDAFLFLRRFKELSDGQKYRYKIAKMMDSGSGTWFFDEFCSTLDRTTAKAVAYTVQKTARRLHKTMVVATTHEDLLEDLRPTVLVKKLFGAEVSVLRQNFEPSPCSLLKDVIIKEGSRQDYIRLEPFHYRSGLNVFVKKIYVAKLSGEVIGAIVYTTPHFSLRARNLVLPRYSTGSLKERLKALNKDFVRIARVVVLPRFRSIGLGVKLVKETMPLMNVPYVEALAVMAKYNPFFEKAGMLKVGSVGSGLEERCEKVLERLSSFGFDIDLMASKAHVLSILEGLSTERLQELKRIILHSGCFIAWGFRKIGLKERIERLDKEAMAEALMGTRSRPIYFIWKNPKFKDHPDPRVIK